MVPLPMARRGGEGKEHVLLRQVRGERFRAHVVAHEDDVFRLILPQGLQDRAQLRVAQDDEDHVVPVLRLQLRHDRDAADGHAEGKLVLDLQAVCPDLLCPASPGEQGHVLPGAEEVPRQIAAEHARAEYQNSHGSVSFL